MHRKTCLFLVLAWFLGMCPGIRASQSLPFSVEEMAVRADRVIHGKVLSKTYLRGGRGDIYTRLVVQVYEVLKGPSTNQYIIVQSGGTLGDQQMVAVGQAEYVPGEEIVDCLMLNPNGEGVSIGLGRGKFTVTEDPVTHEKRVVNPFYRSGNPPAIRPGAAPAGAKPAAPIAGLDDLKARIQGALK
jgi:hypothetical protein